MDLISISATPFNLARQWGVSLLRIINRQFPCPTCGEASEWRTFQPQRSRDNSNTLHAECRRCHTRVFVKQCLSPSARRPDSRRAQREFDALSIVSKHINRNGPSGRRFSVASPLGLLGADAIVIQEYIDAVPLADAMRGADAARRTALVGGAAEWLKSFHAAKPSAAGPVNACAKLATVEQQWRPARKPDVMAALDALADSADTLNHSKLTRSWLHADFKADNLLVAGDRFFGVEPHAGFVNVVAYDLAPFLNNLLLGSQEFRQRSYRSDFERLEMHFVNTYWERPDPCERYSLAWLRLYHFLSMWHTARRGRPALAWLVNRRFRPHTAALTERLLRSADA